MTWTMKNIYRQAKRHFNVFLVGNGKISDRDSVGKEMSCCYNCDISKPTYNFSLYFNCHCLVCYHIAYVILGTDLALLAHCNHTILSYGTFSFLGGFLSGGKRIIPSMILNSPPDKKTPLEADLDAFVMTDEGLEYEADWETKERLGVGNLIAL